MSHLPRRQQPALAKVRGELRTYRECIVCNGAGAGRGYLGRQCTRCEGTGLELTDEISATKATAQARDTRNRGLENQGRQAYD